MMQIAFLKKKSAESPLFSRMISNLPDNNRRGFFFVNLDFVNFQLF